jgi:hypothetical protein
MRVIREFPFADRIKASLFSWNGKYILKLECGSLEQTYKIAETELSGPDEVFEFCSDPAFVRSVAQVFDDMEAAWPPSD